jgi:hypothetical protein
MYGIQFARKANYNAAHDIQFDSVGIEYWDQGYGNTWP